MIVRLPRELKKGMNGRDVLALQRALARAKYRKWGSFSRKFGVSLEKQVTEFEKDHNLKVDGVYGSVTHRFLARYYDAYGAWLMEHARIDQAVTPEQKKRNTIVAVALLGYNKRDEIHYTMGSQRMQGVREKIQPPDVPSWEDCSSFDTWLYWVSLALDPNGLNFNGQGYTGTLTARGKRIVIPEPGDLGFYGNPIGHVAVFIGNGRVISHGSEPGPLLLPTNYRSDLNHWRTYF